MAPRILAAVVKVGPREGERIDSVCSSPVEDMPWTKRAPYPGASSQKSVSSKATCEVTDMNSAIAIRNPLRG